MKKILQSELETLLAHRNNQRIELRHCSFQDLDLTGQDLHDIDFQDSDFVNVILAAADLSRCNLHHTFFAPGCSLRGAKLIDADLSGSIFRSCDFSQTNIEGANLFCSNFEHADMSDIKANEKTQYYALRCPAEGAFVGYKRCFNDSLVQLLIPADAKRSSATANSCRCSKAKVLSITSFDHQTKLQEAWSVVNEEFVYRVGEYVMVDDFDEDRWMDSTTGIHFWMTQEEAYNYLE